LKKTLFKSLFTNYAGLTSACIAKQECTLMHARISFIKHLIILVTFGALTACSDSSTPESSSIPIIEKALFPFIQNYTLYNFNPETGSKEKLAESNRSLMIGLDIDQSEEITEEEDGSTKSTLSHTALPEYVVYVKDQTLRLYDVFTRYDHLLTNFADPSEQNDGEFICDLRPAITIDKEHLDVKEILFKNEESVYIKTSTIETCTGDPSSFRYFEIKIEDSFTETFEIRRITLLKHEHFHSHQHEHDYDHENDHGGNHDHASDNHASDLEIGDLHDSEGHQVESDPDNNSLPKYPNETPHDHSHNETSPDKLHSHKHGINVTDRKNHEHKHEHTHDFKYIIMDEHKFNDDPNTSPESVHNIATNQQTETETHKVLVGKKHVVDSALMYAGNPVVDVSNKRFGYLGFNNSDPESAEASYRFFDVINDGTEKIKLWTMTNSEFSIQPEDYSGYIDTTFSDAVMIEFNWKMVKWNLEDLFDDDKSTERQLSIDNPMFSRAKTPESIYKRANYSINSVDAIAIHEIAEEVINEGSPEETIQERNIFYTVSNEGTQTLIRSFIDENLNFLNFVLLPDHIITLKTFSDGTTPLGSSLTNTILDSRLEQTLNPVIESMKLDFYPDNTFAISIQEDSNPIWRANYFSTELIKKFSLDLENATWGHLRDQRPIQRSTPTPITHTTAPTLLHSETAVEPNNSTSNTVLFEPSVYLFDQSTPNNKGELLGTVPTIVAFAYDTIIRNDLFAQITIRESLTLPKTHKTYYFNPDDPTTEMKLMYEEVFNE